MVSFRYVMLTLAFLLLTSALSSSAKVIESDPVSVEQDSNLLTSAKSTIVIKIAFCIRQYFNVAPKAAQDEEDIAETICKYLMECIAKLSDLQPKKRSMQKTLKILIKIMVWLDCRVRG